MPRPTKLGVRSIAALTLAATGAFGADFLRIIPTQVPPPNISPFVITGFIQRATVDVAGDPLSGGTVTVNGIVVTVPRNTIFQMPASSLTWGELFSLAPAPYAGTGQSGLALNDVPKPLATYEVTVLGNRVIHSASDDRYIAGLVFVSQQSVNTMQGFVNEIDYAKGELWVGSTAGAKTGARVRINDPAGRYGLAHSPDVRFSADLQNPTIAAQTGFPMCIPRNDPTLADDPICPQRNRPVDPITKAYQTTYTMPPPGPALLATSPDATRQTPFEVGDFVTYSGTLVKDPDCAATAVNPCEYISAYSIIANLGIFTAPGVMPAYVRIEDIRLGVAGLPNPLFPQEAVEKLHVVAYSTDPTALVDVFAVDVDSCGRVSHRFYNSADPSGPPFGGVKGRAVVSTAFGNYLPATRELRVVSRTFTNGFNVDIVLPTAKTYANGFIAGQFRAPDSKFIFPENLVIGSPPVPFPFQEFPFLANGAGPYYGAQINNAPPPLLGHVGQLSPWPGLATPAALGCGPAGVLQAPTANAGRNQSVFSGAVVTLNGTASFDPNVPPLPLSFTWVQSGGPAVALQDAGLPMAFFAAPIVKAGSPPATLTFSLVVSNGISSSAVANVNVTVNGR